jgi:large conductance mechanosensitive channel
VKGFRAFILQGNLITLAVAFVIGVAFAAVVTAFVTDIVNPVIAIPGGKPNFDSFIVTANGSQIKYGSFITALIAFVLIAAAVYFAIIIPYNRMQARTAKPAAEPDTRPCPDCLSAIPRAARRCAFCTSPVNPAGA